MGEVRSRAKNYVEGKLKDWLSQNPDALDKVSHHDRAKNKISRDAKLAALVGHHRPERCDLCGGNQGGIVFDHCHATGNFRGWLCDLCNKGLGHFRDDPDLMRKAADYAAAGGEAKSIPPRQHTKRRSNTATSLLVLSQRADTMLRIKSIYRDMGISD